MSKLDSSKARVHEVIHMAKGEGWLATNYQPNICMQGFVKTDTKGQKMRINVYLTKMTVATCLDHPKQGKGQMFRRYVSDDLLKKIFKNPRIHCGKGYKEKDK